VRHHFGDNRRKKNTGGRLFRQNCWVRPKVNWTNKNGVRIEFVASMARYQFVGSIDFRMFLLYVCVGFCVWNVAMVMFFL
jgi:hypothetical protein